MESDADPHPCFNLNHNKNAALGSATLITNLDLSIDGSAEGVTAGRQVGARVHMLEHDVPVPLPVVALAHHAPHVTRVPGTALTKG